MKRLIRHLFGTTSSQKGWVRARTCDNAFTFRMPAGIPGEVNRAGSNITIEPIQLASVGQAPTLYGVPLYYDATTGGARALVIGDTLATFAGLLVRPFPVQATAGSTNAQQALGAGAPPNFAGALYDLLKRGYMTVLLSGAQAAVKGGAVFIWNAAAAGSHIVGGFEAANPGGSGFALTGASFMGPADANGNVEIAFNI